MATTAEFIDNEPFTGGMSLSGYSDYSDKDSVEQQWITFGMRLGVMTALHPFEYAKVLIQLGYEPIAPRPGRTFFGRDVLVLPNIFKYVGYIRRTDDLCGCFVGLTPKLVGTVVAAFGSESVAKRLGYGEIVDDRKPEALTDREFNQVFRRQLSRDILLRVSALCLSQPFHVISVRMMAQFVGQETIYKSFWGSVVEIWSTEGFSGLFSGLSARIACEVSGLVLASTTVFLIQKHMSDKRSNSQINALVNFVCSSLMYPLNVVSTCMAVNGSRLAIGRQPHMPLYRNWWHCYQHLSLTGESKRGSSLFFRHKFPVKNVYVMPAMPSAS